MQEINLFRVFFDRLENSGLKYMVTGATAAIIYGEPRLTNDIDIVIEMGEKDAGRITRSFPSDQFYCPPLEVLEQEARRSLRGHFNVIHHSTGFKADFYLKGKDDLHNWAIDRRKRFKLEGVSIWVAPPEYVILRKLEYYREGKSEKHLRDIAGMIEVSGELIDLTDLEKRVRLLGLEKEWEKAKRGDE